MSEIGEVFRRANETLRERFDRYEIGAGEQLPFLCECTERRCTNLVWLALDEYRAVRDDPVAFVIVPGHDDPEEEQLVGERTPLDAGAAERFAVVRRTQVPRSGRGA